MFFEAPGVASDTWHLVEWLIYSHVSNEEMSQTKKGESKGDPWRPCVITLDEGNPSFWIRG